MNDKVFFFLSLDYVSNVLVSLRSGIKFSSFFP